MEAVSRNGRESELHIYDVLTVLECWWFDCFTLPGACVSLVRTWVKLGSLSGHGRGGILQLVGRRGACAVHAVGGHVSPVSGGGIILGILVLAKRRI